MWATNVNVYSAERYSLLKKRILSCVIWELSFVSRPYLRGPLAGRTIHGIYKMAQLIGLGGQAHLAQLVFGAAMQLIIHLEIAMFATHWFVKMRLRMWLNIADKYRQVLISPRVGPSHSLFIAQCMRKNCVCEIKFKFVLRRRQSILTDE